MGNNLPAVPEPVGGYVIDGVAIEIEPSPLTMDDYYKIKSALIEGRTTDARNVLLCRCLFATGLRIMELLRLTPAHVLQDGPGTILLVKRSKRRRHKDLWERMPINYDVGLTLRGYITGNAIPTNRSVFAISDRQVRNIFARAGSKAIGRPAHPHQLRHLYVKALVEGLGIPMLATARMVGHASSKTTEAVYYDLSEEQRGDINRGLPA